MLQRWETRKERNRTGQYQTAGSEQGRMGADQLQGSEPAGKQNPEKRDQLVDDSRKLEEERAGTAQDSA